MKKENIFFQRRRKPGKENEEFISRIKYVFFAEVKVNSNGKGGKYLEKENI